MNARTENLHEALASLGLASRKNPNERFQGREIYRADNGEVLGIADAKEGWALVARLRGEPPSNYFVYGWREAA